MRAPRTTSLGRLTAVALLVCALSAAVAWPASASSSPERVALRSVNRARTHHGVQTLELQAGISRLARRHSARMAARHRLFHDCVSCILRRHGWRAIGENVGYASSVRSVSVLFMRSREHRANILCSCFTRVGIGVVRSGGRIWITEIFFRP
jgi:uncharacterized protein YkwD